MLNFTSTPFCIRDSGSDFINQYCFWGRASTASPWLFFSPSSGSGDLVTALPFPFFVAGFWVAAEWHSSISPNSSLGSTFCLPLGLFFSGNSPPDSSAGWGSSFSATFFSSNSSLGSTFCLPLGFFFIGNSLSGSFSSLSRFTLGGGFSGSLWPLKEASGESLTAFTADCFRFSSCRWDCPGSELLSFSAGDDLGFLRGIARSVVQ